MTGAEIVVGYLIAWAVRKVKRIGGRVDDEVDRALDAGLDRLHDVVAGRIGADPALDELEREAAGDGVSELTRTRVELSVRAAEGRDAAFAAAVDEAVARLQALAPGWVVASGDSAVAAGRDVHIRAEGGSAAAMTMGDVTIGGPGPDPSRPGGNRG